MGISDKDFILARIIKKISIAPTLMTYKKIVRTIEWYHFYPYS